MHIGVKVYNICIQNTTVVTTQLVRHIPVLRVDSQVKKKKHYDIIAHIRRIIRYLYLHMIFYNIHQ